MLGLNRILEIEKKNEKETLFFKAAVSASCLINDKSCSLGSATKKNYEKVRLIRDAETYPELLLNY